MLAPVTTKFFVLPAIKGCVLVFARHIANDIPRGRSHNMGALRWLIGKFRGRKPSQRIRCIKFGKRNEKDKRSYEDGDEKYEFLEVSFEKSCKQDTLYECEVTDTKHSTNLRYIEVNSGRTRAATLPAEMPSHYAYFFHELMIKNEVEMRPFRKSRRGGICPDNVHEYYRSWDTRNNSM